MAIDWRRRRAVVLQSDDWGLCAWVPDDAAHRALAGEPAFRTEAGQRYGRSTLESAADVRALADVLDHVRGADAMPAVWQANTIVAAPDWRALVPPFPIDGLPLVTLGASSGRWARPGLLDAYADAARRGLWHAELHGLHHLPGAAYLEALRHREPDAMKALAEQSPICTAVEAGGEFGATEPHALRARTLREAVARFVALFGRVPTSFCPPDYRFDDWLEREAESLGLGTLQGKAERAGVPFAGLRRRFAPAPFPHREGGRFYLPARIAFEPRGEAGPGGRVGADAALRAARAAWAAGRPAIVSSHRLNYAHLDAGWSGAGRAALGGLLANLAAEGATFLVDAEVRALATAGVSARPLGPGRTLVRRLAQAAPPVRLPVPAGARGARIRPAAGGPDAEVQISGGTAEIPDGLGEHVVEWTTA